MVLPTIVALIPVIFVFLGILFKNNFFLLLATVAGLFWASSFLSFPPYMWIVVIVIMVFWLIKGK